MYKIAIIGDKDTITPFKVLGIDTFDLEITENINIEVRKLIDKISNEYGVIFIVEEYAKHASDSLEHYKKYTLPIITIIPNNKINLNLGMLNIDKNVEKAIGTNIL